MIRLLHRKLVANSAVAAGLSLTLAAVAADALGWLGTAERWLYDERVARCQYFMPPPTDRLVHLDIDDAALESVQRWPWDRSILAEVMDELALAKPAAVGLDVLFTEPQESGWSRGPDEKLVELDHDALFAASLARLGTAVVPASFSFPANTATGVFESTRDALVEDLEMTESQVVSHLRANGWGEDARLHGKVQTAYLIARRVAMSVRLRRELAPDPALSTDALRRRVLPRTDPTLRSPLTRVFDVQLTRARAALELRRFARRPARDEPVAFHARPNLVPIYPLVRAAHATGFVDYPASSDGLVRSVPLYVEHDGLLYPQMGLSLACATMGVKPDDVRIEPGRVVVPRPGRRELAIPTRTIDRRELAGVARDVPLETELPWFGGTDWESMYDRTGGSPKKQHLSIMTVWEACDARRKLEENGRTADAALLSLYEAGGDAAKVAELEANPVPPADLEARMKRVRQAIEDNEFSAQGIEALDAAEREEKHTVFLASFRALQRCAEQTPELQDNLVKARAALAKNLGGKAVLVGWIATASIADFVPTPLHAKCPGPVLHGVIFNAIMTGEVWRAAPAWASPVVTLLIGLLTTAAVAYFAPGRALLTAVLLGTVYLLLNALVLFDYGNVVLGAAGPLTAVGLVWSGGTLTRLVVEQRQRALIRRRFRTYVDPRLVDYMEKHPEATFDGTNREMTVVFTDLLGFTSITEALGEDTVKLLNELWAQVVPVVRRDGLLNKFLGDGVMFFYGAPEPTSDHAAAAIRTVLELRGVMVRFNAEVTGPRNLPPLGMRFGISTGHMIVGDAGAGEGGSDYTVLGDNVNLGSRLEGANKVTGTSNLMTVRTAELAADAFLFRPVGRIRVVGKQQGVMTMEALCHLADATDHDRQIVAISQEMTSCYEAKNLPACIDAANRLEALCGESKLAKLYRKLAERHLNDPDAEPFDGLITLSEK